MTDQHIQCPHCLKDISLTESLTKHLRSDFEVQFAKERQELLASFEENKKRQDEELAQRLTLLKTQEAQVKQAQEAMEKTLAEKLQEEKKKMWELAQEKAKEKSEVELKELQERTAAAEEKLKAAQEEELKLRRQKRELEEKERTMALEMEKQLEQERLQLFDKAKKEAHEAERLKTLEYKKQIEMMNKTIEELKQKSEQGSQQLQGEVQEADLKQMLFQYFMGDGIEDVPTGIRGGDLVHRVRNVYGKDAGVILWESKNTKTWSNDWLKKLKDDQGLVKADLCILVSKALPDTVKHFAEVDGVWVTSYEHVLPLTHALRSQLLAVHQMRSSLVGRDEKMEHLYEYLAGSQFKHRVETIVNAFVSLKNDLESEKRMFARMWSKREKEIDRVVNNTSGLYGDLQGIIGNTLPYIETLEVPLLEEGEL